MSFAEQVELLRRQFRLAATDETNCAERRSLAQAWWQVLADDGIIPQHVGFHPDEITGLIGQLPTNPAPALIDRAFEILDGLTSAWYADGSFQNSDRDRWMFLKSVSSYRVEARSIVFTCRTQRPGDPFFVRLSFPYADTLRVRFNANAEPPEETGEAFTTTEKEGAIVARAARLLVKIATSPWRLSVHLPCGKELCAEDECQNLGFRLSADGNVSGVRDSFFQADDEHYYGFGERFDRLDQKGRAFSTWVTDSYTQNYNHRDHTTYIPIPFFISSKGWGLFVNSSHRIFFDMGEATPGRCTTLSADNSLEYYLIASENPLQTIARYTDIVGKPLLPPRWAFTPWMGRGSWKRDSGVDPTSASRQIIESTRQLQIPFGVVYPEGARFTKDDLDELHRQEIRVAQWACPAVLPTEATLPPEDAWQLDYLRRLQMPMDEVKEFAVREGGSPFAPRRNEFLAGLYFIDFTNPTACERFQEQVIRRHYLAVGYDLLMLDGGEALSESTVCFNGKTGREMHNGYLPYYHKTYADAFRAERGDDFLLFSRAGYVGSHRHVAQFSGDHDADFHSIGAIIRGGLNMGLCGFPYQLAAMLPAGVWGVKGEGVARDVGIRWLQFSTFWPLMLTYGTTPDELELYGEEFSRVYRYFASLRMNLVPYLYHHAIESHSSGIPIVRSLFLAYPDDARTYDVEDEYLFGSGFLVAPVIEEGATERSVYFPAGEWVDFWDNRKRYFGRTRVTCEAPLDKIPVFVRDGSVTPLELNAGLKLGEYSSSAETFLVYDIYPSALLSKLESFRAEEKLARKVSCRKDGERITVSISGGHRNTLLRIDARQPRSCSVAGLGTTEFFGLEELIGSKGGFLYDCGLGKVYVKVVEEETEICLE